MGLLKVIFKSLTNRESKKAAVKEFNIYQAIKEDPELAPRSKKLATRSIMFSCFALLTLIIAIVGCYLLITKSQVYDILFVILGIIGISAVAIILLVNFIVRAIRSLVYQFKLNKTPITWVALSIVIFPALLAVAGVAILVIAYLSNK